MQSIEDTNSPTDVARVGVVGTGFISAEYLRLLRTFPNLELVACADLDRERARAAAAEFEIAEALTVEELIAAEGIEIVVNLTAPVAHAEVSAAALRAGKHVYSEKPLALTGESAAELLQIAAANEVLLGCAPDTVLGAGLQTARRAIDEGLIGRPVSAFAAMVSHGWEAWHPSPGFYYQPGGGPLYDMGPYYLTALVGLLGPVGHVTGLAGRSFDERVIERDGEEVGRIPVDVDTHVAGVLGFEGGPIASLLMSFDVWRSKIPRLEIHGSEASLICADPNWHDGPVLLGHPGREDWVELEIEHGFTTAGRGGLGVAELAVAAREGREPRASGRVARHVLDVIESLGRSAEEGRRCAVESECERPLPLPPDFFAETSAAQAGTEGANWSGSD